MALPEAGRVSPNERDLEIGQLKIVKTDNLSASSAWQFPDARCPIFGFQDFMSA